MEKIVHSNTETSGISLKSLMASLVFLGIFFIPFSSFKGIPILGEFAREPSAIFFILASLALLIEVLFRRKIIIPIKNLLFQMVLLLFGWFLIATILNIPDIHNYYFKGRTGYERFFLQFLVLIVSGIVFVTTYFNVFRNYTFEQLFIKIRKVFYYSMAIVTTYAILEILILKFKLNFFYYLLWFFNFFPFTEVNLDYGHYRISSVTFESPALATYLLTVAGWMFSYVITEKGIKKFLPAFFVIVLALFSGSRAALFVIFFQVIVFGLLLIRKRKHHQILISVVLLSLLVGSIAGAVKGDEIATSIVDKINSFDVRDNTHAISNRSRFGIQYANFLVFTENPIVGVGYGMQAYEARYKYPKWATVNNWEFRVKYFNEKDPSFPPGYNIYARILAESGLIGLILFLFFLVILFYTIFRIIKKNDSRYLLAVVIFISMIGFFFNWLKVDTIRVFGFWINFALILVLTSKTNFVFSLKKKNES